MTKAVDRDIAFMRTELARNAGIFLDDAKPMARGTEAAEFELPIDRDEVRAVLVERGAPDRDLEWLVASCPGIEYALTYKPTRVS